ncbi:MAG: stage sporulation protein [Bacilli bacterium]|nr:stage sporulation protein [Bacilli bacterium]
MEKKVKVRSMVIGLIFTLLFAGLMTRMYWVQVVQASMLEKKAEKNWQDEESLPAKRGAIVDRNNVSLAEEGSAFTIAVSPEMIALKKLAPDVLAHEISHGLAAILGANAGVDPIELEKTIFAMATKKKQDSSKYLVEVEVKPEGWKIDVATKNKVDEMIQAIQLGHGWKPTVSIGVSAKETEKRYYPYNSLASHVLGYLDKEGKPIGGVEDTYDSFLKGTPGKYKHESDKAGVELPDSKVSYTPADMGKTVQLTIDQNIQYYLETAMQKSMDQFHPKSMSAIAVDPKTMEILAMASAPTFDPNRYWEAKQSDYKNTGISSRYEPGSTFKIVTLAGTVAENLFNPNETYQSGSINVHGSIIKDHNGGAGWGIIPFMDGLLYSSNVAFVKLGYEKLGPDKLRSYIDKFGFGVKTGIDLPNEIPGIIAMKYPVEFATATFGQGQVGTTLLQQAAAYAAIANGGKLMWPHIVKDIIDPQTKQVIQSFAPKVVRQVVSPDVANQTSLYLEQVVANQDKGTGKKAYLNGYRIAGKTGTAQIVEPGEKVYSTVQYNISFIGYAPVEDPKILIAIMSEEPDIGGDYHRGSEVWYPVFRDVMSQSLRYMGITSTAASSKTSIDEPIKTIPDLSNATLASAKSMLYQMGLQAQVFGKGGKVVKQYPLPNTEISMTQQVYITTEANMQAIPDFKGKSLRDALEVCSLLELQCKVSGEGYVTTQTVAGEGAQQIITLELHPLSEVIPEPVATVNPTSEPKTDTKKEVTAASAKKSKKVAH